jgi:hypothetical protein
VKDAHAKNLTEIRHSCVLTSRVARQAECATNITKLLPIVASNKFQPLTRPSLSHSSSTIHLLAHLYFHSILPRSSPLLYPLAQACIGGQVQRVCGSCIPLHTHGGSRFTRTADPVLHRRRIPLCTDGGSHFTPGSGSRFTPAADPLCTNGALRPPPSAGLRADAERSAERGAGSRRRLQRAGSGRAVPAVWQYVKVPF